ncbi:MAG: 16S rRNA (guanine(966)-N(2))-methyltransferase RsmD [Acidobacteriota bacterium]
MAEEEDLTLSASVHSTRVGGQMRVISGSARGRRLKTVPGLELRPTLDRVRQAVFSSLGSRIPGAGFLDLFAGCGAVGIEALSRGAGRVVFVESCRACCGALAENLEACALGDRARTLQCDWRAGLERLRAAGERFDVIYADPPYGRYDEAGVLSELSELLASEGVLLLEHPGRRPVPQGVGRLRLVRGVKYGQTSISWYAPQQSVDRACRHP